MANDLITYEDKARFIKASKLAEVFSVQGASIEDVKALDEKGWMTAARIARVLVPSQQTRDEVVERMKFRAELEATLPADPFARFPVGVQ